MSIPEAFLRFTQQWHQDINEVYGGDDPIGYLLDGLSKQTKVDLRTYLTELLASKPSGAELQELWREGDSDWSIYDDEDLRKFLTEVRDRILKSH